LFVQDIYWYSLIKYCVANGAYIGCDPPDLGLMSEPPGIECRAITSPAVETSCSALPTVSTGTGDSDGSVQNCVQYTTDTNNVITTADQLNEVCLSDKKPSESASRPRQIEVGSATQSMESKILAAEVDSQPAELCSTMSNDIKLHSTKLCLNVPREACLAQGKHHSTEVSSAMLCKLKACNAGFESLPSIVEQHPIREESFCTETIHSEIHQNDVCSTMPESELKDLQSEQSSSVLSQPTDDLAYDSNINNSNSQMLDQDASVDEADKSSKYNQMLFVNSEDADCLSALSKPAVSNGSSESKNVDPSFDLVPCPVVNAKPLPCASLSNRYLQRLEQEEGVKKDSQLTSRSSSQLSRTSTPDCNSVDSALLPSVTHQVKSGACMASNESPDLEKKILRQMEVVM